MYHVSFFMSLKANEIGNGYVIFYGKFNQFTSPSEMRYDLSNLSKIIQITYLLLCAK